MPAMVNPTGQVPRRDSGPRGPQPWGRVAVLACLAAALAAGAARAEAPPAPRIADAQVLAAPNVVIAGMPDRAALLALDPARTIVVDFRTPEEGTAAWQASLTGAGFSYHNLPFEGTAIDPAQLDALAAIRGTAGDATLVLHCASGNRAGYLWGALLVRDGVPVHEVLERVGGVVTRETLRAGLEEYAAGARD